MQVRPVFGRKGGVRFEIADAPTPGSRLELTDGTFATFREIGMAGMLCCVRDADPHGCEQLIFPQQIARVLPKAALGN
jgi:hypothetical protein